MVWDDIRGEELPVLGRDQTTSEALWEAAGASAELLGAVAGPFAALGLMWGFDKVFRAGMHAGGSALKAGGRAAWPAVRKSYELSKNAIMGASSSRNAHWSAAGTIGAAGLAMAGTGLSAMGAGIRNVASIASPVAGLGAVGLGAGAGIYQVWANERDARKAAFAASANGYMARGAAMRARWQGHY